jgi:hypothetical protein
MFTREDGYLEEEVEDENLNVFSLDVEDKEI